jgi:monoamine oxidase
MALSRRNLLAGLAAASVWPIAGARATDVADVVIIGAGLSGLNAALHLEEQGARVLVLEGRQRPGGRVWTLDDVPGRPEAGGNGIGSGYARLLYRAETLGVDMQPIRVRTEFSVDTALISVRGETIAPRDWERHRLNPFIGDTRATPPWAVSFGAFAKINPLGDVIDWRAQGFAQYDVAVADVLAARGWTPDALQLAFATNPSYGRSAYDVSAMMWYHILKNAEMMSIAGTGAMSARGGNQAIPIAMAHAVKGGIRYGARARVVRADAGGVEVLTDGGSVRARAAIVAVPTSALRLMRVEPALPKTQQAGIDMLPYNRVFQLHMLPTRRFWEDDGLPTAMWTDTMAGRLIGLRYGADADEVTSIVAFVSGFAAERLDRMSPEMATAAVLADIETLRPAAKGALRPIKIVSWGRDEFAGGAYACWAPGQIRDFANVLPKPMGRVVFAGEHTAEIARGMEGAMEAGERAAFEVLELI